MRAKEKKSVPNAVHACTIPTTHPNPLNSSVEFCTTGSPMWVSSCNRHRHTHTIVQHSHIIHTFRTNIHHQHLLYDKLRLKCRKAKAKVSISSHGKKSSKFFSFIASDQDWKANGILIDSRQWEYFIASGGFCPLSIL